MGTHDFMQSSDCVINYLNRNKFFVALPAICDTFGTLTSKNAIFICLGEIRFLGYKVDKVIFVFSGSCLNFIFYK